MSAPPAAANPLPPLVECLFGETGKCPKLRTKSIEDPTSPDSIASSQYDGLSDRWGDAAKQHDIDLAKLRRVCSQGIDDDGSHRGVAWRVLLEYLETDNIHVSWSKNVPAQRERYASLVQEYIEGPLERGKELRGQLSKLLRDRKLRKKFNRCTSLDKPDEENSPSNDADTSDGEGSVTSEQTMESNVSARVFTSATKIVDRLPPQFQDAWKKAGIDVDHKNSDFTTQVVTLGINQLKIPEDMTEEEFQIFLEDAKLLGEIRKDVARTHPDLFFYLDPKDHLGMRRYGALERILFIWSKLNKGVRYVQGMNEIVGTIYYVLANDHNSEWGNHAEADSYYLFHSIMMDMQDVFVPDMDATHTGLQGRIANLQRLLKTHDPEVHEHLEELGIDVSFFAIRWLTTLLSREFLLPDTIRLWDSMFASTHKENFLRYVCGSMVMMIRDDLLKGDFGQCLRLLQSYPPGDVDSILISSRSLWIYESQITLACHKGGVSLHQALHTISPPPSIVMAFGHRGGVAPRFSMSFSDAIGQSLQNSPIENTNNDDNQGQGLFGRVKRFWTGGSQKPTAATATGAGAAIQQSDSATSSGSQDKHDDETTSIVTAATSTTTTTAATEATGATNASGVGPPVSRIWNRNIEPAPPAPPTRAVSDTPVRRPIWNRDRSGGSVDDATTAESDPNAPPRRPFWKPLKVGGDQSL